MGRHEPDLKVDTKRVFEDDVTEMWVKASGEFLRSVWAASPDPVLSHGPEPAHPCFAPRDAPNPSTTLIRVGKLTAGLA